MGGTYRKDGIDSFSTFLRNVQLPSEGSTAVPVPEPESTPASPDRTAQDASLTLLKLLAGRGTLPIADLLSASGLQLTVFAGLLETAKRNDLLHVRRVDEKEFVALTPMGEKLASIL